ncbi:hypothetical protein BX600DRAFT_469980 [Xylariales sp. PMI_506]|nr:hypothetical protein BX600DRAFT_469980 [Xylariales sp. PMI_506]
MGLLLDCFVSRHKKPITLFIIRFHSIGIFGLLGFTPSFHFLKVLGYAVFVILLLLLGIH